MASCKEEHLVCPICIDIIDHATLLGCGHTFCRACLQELYDLRGAQSLLSCPVCRDKTKIAAETGVEGLSPNVIINGLVDDYKMYLKSAKACLLHKQHEKELFCEDCSVHICVRCVVTGHLNHRMKTREDFEREIQEKVDCLMQRGQAMKADMETVITSTEAPKPEVAAAIDELERRIKHAFETKSQLLKKNEASLLDEIHSLQRSHDYLIDDQTYAYKQIVEDINRALAVITADNPGSLEADSLASHTMVCSDLDELLEEYPDEIDVESTGCAKEVVLNAEFHPVGDGHLNLGMVKMRKKMKVLREVQLPYLVEGLAAKSQVDVEVGYGAWMSGSELYGVTADCDQGLFRECDIGEIWSIANLSTGHSALSNGPHAVTVYNSNDEQTHSQYNCTSVAYACQICSDQDDCVYVANGDPDIAVFQVERTVNSQRIVRTGDIRPRQVAVTSTGVIIASTCDTTPSTVAVFGQDGGLGSCIKATDENECLYATVDSRDRVLIARVRQGSSALKVAAYTLHDDILTEKIICEDIQLSLEVHTSLGSLCHLVSLTPELLAFGHYNSLSFIKVPF